MYDKCPQCDEQTIVHIGEAYDDEEYLGSAFECLNCDFHFTINSEGYPDYEDGDFSVKL